MNRLFKRTITLTFCIWEPQEKKALEEIGELIVMLNRKELLAHAGYVKLRDESEEIKS